MRAGSRTTKCCCIFVITVDQFPYHSRSFGSTGVYLFRDPACNFLAGKGFSAACNSARILSKPVCSASTSRCPWSIHVVCRVPGCGVI